MPNVTLRLDFIHSNRLDEYNEISGREFPQF